MEEVKALFDIKCIAFDILGYQLSYLELTGVLFGLIAVYLMALEKRSGWLFGLVNVVLAAILYFQIQLYSDFFLQFYYFATNLYGWWFWKGTHNQSDTTSQSRKISHLDLKDWGWVIACATIGTVLIGNIINRLHLFFPVLFTQPAAYPFADTVVLTLSLIAQYLMAKKVVESWILWIAVDVLATYLYAQKLVWFLSFEYFVFTILAVIGWRHWRKAMTSQL